MSVITPILLPPALKMGRQSETQARHSWRVYLSTMYSTFDSIAKGLAVLAIIYFAAKVPLVKDGLGSLDAAFASAKAELNVTVLEDTGNAVIGLMYQGHDALTGMVDHAISSLR